MEFSDSTLARTPGSRLAGRITAFGALLVIVAFIGFLWQLHSLEAQLQAKRSELGKLSSEAKQLSVEVQNLKLQVGRFRQLNQRFNEAVQSQTDRNYADSRDRLLEIVKEDPNNEVALYWLARACSKLSSHGDALKYASKAIAIDSQYIDPYVVMVYSLHSSGNQAQAIQCLRYALNMNIEAYPYFSGRTRDLSSFWNIKAYRDVFLVHEQKIRLIQRSLARRGLYEGQADGLVGSGTRSAIARFCQSQNITNTVPVDLMIQRLGSVN